MRVDRGVVVFVSLMIAVAAVFILRPTGGPVAGELATFQSQADLVRFLDHARSQPGGGILAAMGDGLLPGLPQAGSMERFSRTNVQVAGVDELDVVKTDGEYLYLVSATNVTVVEATPPGQMHVVARISTADLGIPPEPKTDSPGYTTGLYIAGIFVEGDRLAIVSTSYGIVWLEASDRILLPEAESGRPRTYVSVFVLSPASAPSLDFVQGVSGSLSAARSTNGHLYAIVQDYIMEVDEEYVLPETCSRATCEAVQAQRIYYDPESKDAGLFTNILAVNFRTGTAAVMSIVTGYTSVLYMSSQSLYLTFVKWVGVPSTPDEWRAAVAWTSIYKILASGISLHAAAEGDVPGTVLNQFSMDEHDGLLRVATTTGWGESNNVYVLNGTLDVIGSLVGLAPGERIFSARFLGDVLYLVTFRQVDPFFVIDLSDPTKPKVLGEVEIPGFSTYLHPVDETHVLGVGMENQTLKLSLFDVSDPSHPIESSKFSTDEFVWSVALYDHKAILFDRSRELLVLPISRWDGSASGAYVFRVSPATGISLRGVISHAAELGYADVYRSLYIGETLYTISPYLVKAHSLVDLSEVGSLVYEPPPEAATKG